MIWYIAIGSAAGGVGRYVLSSWVQRLAAGEFPLGTMAVNLLGSFLLGFLMRWALEVPTISAEARGMLTIGFCGGFTTFSTFSYETARLLQDGEIGRAGLYVGGSVLLSVGAMFLGLAAGGR